MPQRNRLSHRERMLAQMGAMQQMDLNDAQLAALFQRMGMEKERAPLEQEALRAGTEFERAKAKGVEREGDFMERKLEADALESQMRGVGALGMGLAGSPELSEDALQQVMERFGLYKPDPKKQLERAAARQGMSVEMYQRYLDRITKGKEKK